MSSTQPARGTRDFLPADVRRRGHVIDVVRRVYERYGFEPIETPAFENIETLTGKYGEEGAKLIFKILKRGEHESSGQADLALRYDLTVPLARVVAEYQSTLPKYFRRYQIQPVWRADRPARGRFREFYQCDIDAIGSTSPVVEVEVLSAVSEVLTTLGFQDFRIRLNDRRVLQALLAAAGVPPDRETDALVSLDKLDKIGPGGVTADMVARGLDPGVAAACSSLFASEPDRAAGETLASLRARLDERSGVLASLDTIVALAESSPVAGRIRIDPSLARGLSYYTGAIMEIAVPDLAGSLGGGGRYDNLVGMFLGREVPACGFSLGLERIIVVMAERGMFPPDIASAPADVMVALWDESSRADALALAGRLRQQGLRVDVYPEPDKPGRQFKYAASRHYGVVVLAGEDERRSGTVTVKNMRTASQVTVPLADVASAVQSQLGTASVS
jgi:histidyl-tRNA synthetase